jgi:putative colanic acid biosynthesis UDP-glucose lipid carrier transferase
VIILLLFAPLLLLIAILVKVSSPGPIIFKQRRYGLDGHEIAVYKFRTMSVTEDGAQDPAGIENRQPHHAHRRPAQAHFAR